MTPDERQLIVEFFDRLAAQGAGDKDRAADTLIAQELRRNPDAPYLLVQTALVYEQQFAEMEARIKDLEAQLARTAQDDDEEEGSFLGDKLGQRRPAAMQSARGSGAGYGRVDPQVFRDDATEQAPASGAAEREVSPWGGGAPARSPGFGRSGRAPEPVQDPGAAPVGTPAAPPARPASGGGFLRAAVATAAGVAGGLMLGETLKGLLGGDSAHAQTSGAADQSHTDGAEGGKLDAASDEAFFEEFPDDGSDADGGIEI